MQHFAARTQRQVPSGQGTTCAGFFFFTLCVLMMTKMKLVQARVPALLLAALVAALLAAEEASAARIHSATTSGRSLLGSFDSDAAVNTPPPSIGSIILKAAIERAQLQLQQSSALSAPPPPLPPPPRPPPRITERGEGGESFRCDDEQGCCDAWCTW